MRENKFEESHIHNFGIKNSE